MVNHHVLNFVVMAKIHLKTKGGLTDRGDFANKERGGNTITTVKFHGI